ncbi:hypothetical protein SmJEL517_g02898 [Synchytrium microbalum]|uniref:Uncharacterized protein n=1 Tax=Synchytrium microbalum TaxID=1806994 RepID=A0A507BZ43_9FUNG|nr:uncharacterized protein SmJEL517_g02898 [Synchytrium microbalum]TPX34540.1 hypothetical protein SmJEL517_g02898 [Synchytrium microbalum]
MGHLQSPIVSNMVTTDPDFGTDAAIAVRRVYPTLLPDDVLLETPTFRAGSVWDRADEFRPPTATTRNYIYSQEEFRAGGDLGPRTSLHLNLAHSMWAFDSLEQALRFHRDYADTNAGNDAERLDELTAVIVSPAAKLTPQGVPPNLRVGEESKLYVGLSTSTDDVPRRQRASIWSLVYLFVCENTVHRLELTKIGRGAAVAKGNDTHGSVAALQYLHSEDGRTDLALVGRLVRVLEGRTVEMAEMGLVHGSRRFSDAVRECVPSMRKWANDWERHVTKLAPKPTNPAILSAKARKIIDDLKSGKAAMMVAALHWEEIDPVMEQFVRHGGIEAVVDLLLSHPLNSERPKDLQRVLGARGGICMQASIVLGLALREPAGSKYYPGRAVLSKLVTMFCRGDVGETMAALHVLADLCAGPPPGDMEGTSKNGGNSAPAPPKKDPSVMTKIAESVWVLAGMSIMCRMGDLYRTFGDLENLRDDHGFYAAMEDLLASFSPALISWDPEPGVADDFACHGDQTYVLGHCVSGGLDAAYHLFQLWATANDDTGRASKIPPMTEICSRVALLCEGLPSVAEQLRGYKRWQDVRRLVTAATSPELAAVHGWNDLWKAFTDLVTRCGGLPRGGVEEARRLRGIGVKGRPIKEAKLVETAPAPEPQNGSKRTTTKAPAKQPIRIYKNGDQEDEDDSDEHEAVVVQKPKRGDKVAAVADKGKKVAKKPVYVQEEDDDEEEEKPVVQNFDNDEDDEEEERAIATKSGRKARKDEALVSLATDVPKAKVRISQTALELANVFGGHDVELDHLEVLDKHGRPMDKATILKTAGKKTIDTSSSSPSSRASAGPTSPTSPIAMPLSPSSPAPSNRSKASSKKEAVMPASPQSTRSFNKIIEEVVVDDDEQWEEDTPQLRAKTTKKSKRFPARTTSIAAVNFTKSKKGAVVGRKSAVSSATKGVKMMTPPLTPPDHERVEEEQPEEEEAEPAEDDDDTPHVELTEKAESLMDFDPLFATESRKRDRIRKAQSNKAAEERRAQEALEREEQEAKKEQEDRIKRVLNSSIDESAFAF